MEKYFSKYIRISILFSRRLQGEGAVTEESARIMLKRGLKQSGDGFVFTRDLRHRVPSLYGFVDEYLEEFAKNISCPHLLIKVVGWEGSIKGGI